MSRGSQLSRALRIALVSSVLPLSLQVNALEFDVSEDLKVNVDTTLTYGRQWRVDGRDKHLMSGHISPDAGRNAGAPPGELAQTGVGSNAYVDFVQLSNADDGTRNFDKWDTVSSRFAGISDINISYKNVGFFVRPQIFYDEVPFGETSWSGKYLDRTGNYGGPDTAMSDNNQLSAGSINSVEHFDSDYKNQMGYQARFLDVYAYGSFDIDGRSLDVRVGRQVISWGEALMLQGGIAFAQNRIDASAATAPGVELKEIFLPTGAVYGSLGVTENMTVEAYWQYEWLKSELFPTGSYFSAQDMIDGDKLIGTPVADNQNPNDFFNPAWGGYYKNEHEPDNNKQFGMAFRYLLDEGTEAAFYVVNYTDKFPSLWVTNGLAANVPINLNASGPSQEYGINYFENIRMYGLTLNTVVSGVQVGVEYAYRANAPIVPTCTPEGLLVGHCKDRSYELFVLNNNPNRPTNIPDAQSTINQYMFSWPTRAEIHSLNIGGTYIFQPNPLWDTAVLVGEIGGWYVGGFENEDLRNGILGGFTKYGEGMSAQFMPEYKNVMEGVDLTIPFFVNYGIDGSLSTFNYNEQNLWWSVGVEAIYLEHWRFATYYNDFSGPNNLWVDRDNLSFNIKYVF